MSFTDLKYVHALDYQWRDPLHFCVMAEIAKRYNPTYGYAWPALDTIGRRYSRSGKRIGEVTVELEHLGLMIRLGPDPEALGSNRGTQRFVPIWRVENGVQQQLRDALEADDAATRGAAAVASTGDPAATHRVGAPDASGGGHPVPRVGGTRPVGCDPGTSLGTFEVPRCTETATAAAQLRLPAVLAEIRRTLVDEILRRRRAFLAIDPAKDGNFAHIAKAVEAVLGTPALGARLVKGYEPDLDSNVIEAARRLCDKRHIDWGKPHYDTLRGALDWVRTKQKILAGEPRPRDAARKAR